MKCPRCGIELPDGAKFCLDCGHQLAETTKKASPSRTARGERKQVTALFSDLSGYTSMTERLDPEEVKRIVGRIFQEVRIVVDKYQGYVERFSGDGVLVLFGAPRAHEDDSVRAVQAAIEIHDLVEAISPDYEKTVGRALTMHSGINTGLVVIEGIDPERGTISATGDAINVASRLSDLAEAKQIIAGPDTYRLTQHLFNFEALGLINVQGRKEPVRAYRLSDKRSGLRAGRLLRRGISSRVVGRDAELRKLRNSLDALALGRGGIVSVIGEAGLGKSRLVAEFRGHVLGSASLSRVQWLEGRTLSFGQTISYWPFQEILWTYAGITENDSDLVAWQKLGTRITALFGDNTSEVLPYLASLISLEVRGDYAERVKYLDGEAMRRQVFLAAHRFFERLAQTQPLVLVFEDLHWIDESSAVLIEHLLPLVKRLPLLVVGISRPDPETPAMRLREMASSEYADSYTEISLFPLSKESSRDLLNNIFEYTHVSQTVAETILRKAEGNPFFLEEIIQSLIDQDIVTRDRESGHWRVSTELDRVKIPDTIQGVLMERLDRLDEDVRQVLRTAAVIGRSFLYRVLCAVREVDGKLDGQLEELQLLELIREKQRNPELEYMFRHALAQEATYESIMLEKRRELHRRIGAAIESLFADRLEEFYSLLAYHYAKAEAWEKAQEHLFKAGDQALGVAADAEALAHYRRALAAYEQAFGDRWEPLQRASLERKMGEAFFRRGEHEEATKYLGRAFDYLGKPLPRSRLKLRTALFSEIVRQVAHRFLPAVFLKPVSETVSPEVEELVRTCEITAWIEAFGDTKRFLISALRVINTSERTGYASGMARGNAGLGITGNLLAMYRLAYSYHHRSHAAAIQSGNPAAIGLSHLGLAHYFNCLGQWGRAIEYCEKAADTYHEIGELRGWGYVTYMKAFALSRMGNFSSALQYAGDVARTGSEGADPQTCCWGLWTQGHVLRCLGRFQEAMESLSEAMRLAESAQDYVFHVAASHELGVCYLRRGELDNSLRLLEEAKNYFVLHPTRAMIYLPFLNGLPQAHLAAAEENEGQERSSRLKQAASALKPALKQGKQYPGVMPEVMLLKGRYEWLRGKSKSARKWWLQSLSLAEKLNQPYDVGLTLSEMGLRMKEKDSLEKAEAVFTKLGAEWDAARVRFAKSCL